MIAAGLSDYGCLDSSDNSENGIYYDDINVEITDSEHRLAVVLVPGNCDESYNREYRIIKAKSGNIMVIHGHTEGVDLSTDRLCYMAREQSCRAVCYGHTPAANITKSGDVRLINPGRSLTRPRLGTGAGCALC